MTTTWSWRGAAGAGTPENRPGQRVPVFGTLLLAAVGVIAYLKWAPLSPDLAAQVARANVVRAVGVSSWWTGWFGGMSLPNYSVLTPSTMALLGVRTTGVCAVLVAVAASTRLAGKSLRPRATVVASAATAAADLLDGRVTFAVGFALGMTALVAMSGRSHRWLVLTLALATYLASPLAGLFLAIVMVSVGLTDRARRNDAVIVLIGLVLVAALMAVLFTDTGTMPFDAVAALPAALCCLATAALCRRPVIRLSALLTLAALVVFLVVPTAVGANITRLAWMSAIPAVVGCAQLSRRWLAAAVVLLACWPLSDLAGQLQTARQPSAQASFYAPLITELAAQRTAAGSDAIGSRVEVVDTASHWASVYLTGQSLARGWDRQADNTDNPLFYTPGSLTATSYRQWLDSLAVRWVAVPHASLDFAAAAERDLIAAGQPYLSLVWSNSNWLLYRLDKPAPFVTGATVTAVHQSSIDLTVTAGTEVALRVRWSPYLTLLPLTADPAPATALVSSCISNADGFVSLAVAKSGSYQLTSRFRPELSLQRPDPDCRADLVRGNS